jgi:hypothetical protein
MESLRAGEGRVIARLQLQLIPMTRNLILSYLTILKWTAELRSPTLIQPARRSIAFSVLRVERRQSKPTTTTTTHFRILLLSQDR